MTRRTAVELGLATVSLAALIARVIALALADLDRSLRNFPTETPDVVPLWLDEAVDLP